MAEEQAGIFITGPAAIDMTFERAKVERLAGKPREARVLTRAAINLVNQADKDIDPGDRMRSEEHTSELQSLMRISYAVFCLKKKNTHNNPHNPYSSNARYNSNYQHKRT